jgi:GntR family transcriptional regulator
MAIFRLGPNTTHSLPLPGPEDSFAPKYYWLKRILRERIAQLDPGADLPSESELCQTYAISRTTVRKAIGDLIQEGLIYTVQGKGAFVAPRKLLSAWVQKTGGLYADMTERGFRVTMRVLHNAMVAPEETIRGMLELEPGETVLHLVRLRFVDGKPFDVVTNFIPSRLFPGIENEDFEHNSLYALMRGKYAAHFERGVRLVEAGACSPEEARLLEIRARSPILITHSTMFNDRGQPVEHGIVHQRSDVAQIVINVIPD